MRCDHAPQIKAGTVTALAVTSATRNPALPDVPTVMEQGVPSFDVAGWFGLLAPGARPPAAIRQRLRDEWRRVLKDPDMVSQLASQGMAPVEPTGRMARLSQERICALEQGHQGGRIKAE